MPFITEPGPPSQDLIPRITGPITGSLDILSNPFALDLTNPLINRYITREVTPTGEYYAIDDTLACAIWFHMVDLADRIAAAASSFVPGTTIGSAPTTLHAGAARELQLAEPKIFRFLEDVQRRNPLTGRWTPGDWWNRWQDVQSVGKEAMDWVQQATQRTRELQGSVPWTWDAIDLARRLRYLDDATSFALIPHPIYGSNAQSALTTYDPALPQLGSATTRDPRKVANLCRELILHPVLSSEAPNAVTRYGDPSGSPTYSPSAPPTSPASDCGKQLVTEEDVFGGRSDDDDL